MVGDLEADCDLEMDLDSPTAVAPEKKGMLPWEIKETLEELRGHVQTVIGHAERQKQHNVGYYELVHELTETEEALDRAIEACDDMEKGLT